MSKRSADVEMGDAPLKGGDRPEGMEIDEKAPDMGEFEDEFEDEFEEDEIMEAGVDGRPDAEREAEEREAAVDQGTFIVGRNKLEAGQTLAPDVSTYEMLHNLSTPWPCLSFDILRDSLGDNRKVYPATMYTVAGTQAENARAGENQLMVMKFSGLSRTEKDDEESDDDDEDGDEDAEPILEHKAIPLNSTTNRIRAHQIPSQDASRPPTTLTATMTESSNVFIHDITPHIYSFDNPGTVISAQQNKPVSTIRAHKAEGYALDWSPLVPSGKLLTGDNDGLIYVTTRTDGGGFVTDTRPFQGHTSSVEEIQWSPSEQSVFSSASSDGTIRVWDVRSKSRKPALSMHVSNHDVNVMSWSPLTTHLLASGADDGEFAVWDLRQWKQSSTSAADKPSPIASFNYHKEQVTSIEWHPTDDSIIAVAAGDNTVTLWDLAVELDDEESKDTGGVKDVPPQLLFVHYLSNVKELHWHPQITGSLMATGDEFSVFHHFVLFNMRYLANLALLCHLAHGAPSTPAEHSARTAAVFEVDRFFAGSLPPSTRNFVIFSVQPTPGADFANCTINTDTGSKVPTVDKVVCTDVNSITWSLEPMGTGMHFSVWWAFTSHASLLGGIHLDESYFKDTTLADGTKSQSYVGPHKFTLETTMVMNNPGGKRKMEESVE
ncbi:WD domain-containing protein [Colletotrichum cuscutae]|uniref:Glutamate-rich WD repeat-containing protein 1 n=1 Tax=Colletotrichum cuscutae TaxID=1209917 RepID=A0AAI9UCZ2_9PEZI|nr:WD domain-containing protein [Colletotrichum cuscutae]